MIRQVMTGQMEDDLFGPFASNRQTKAALPSLIFGLCSQIYGNPSHNFRPMAFNQTMGRMKTYSMVGPTGPFLLTPIC